MRTLDWQRQTYLNGYLGQQLPVSPDWIKLEARATAAMTPEAAAYIGGGAGLQKTIERNRTGFDHWQIVPRMLVNVESEQPGITLFGHALPSPLLACPIGVLEMVHPEADVAVAKAAAELGVPYIFSNQASVPMETCADAMGNSPRFFQLYWSRSRDLVLSFVRRAEACGCSAIVVTLDTTFLGWRVKDLDIAHLPFLWDKGIAQYTTDPVFRNIVSQMRAQLPADLTGLPTAEALTFSQIYNNPTLTWEDLSFLREHTQLPILLKGILHPDDARKAVDAGMDGIVVSNHGGRQVDGSISTIEALPAIADAVRGQIPVLFDSGIRGGADMFKAIALGATAVCVGRPYVWGLTLAGQAGVREVLQQLMNDFDLTMRLAGCRAVGDINRDCLANAGF